MKQKYKTKDGLAQGHKGRKKMLSALDLVFIRQNVLHSFFAALRLCAKTVIVFGLGSMLALFSGCATTTKQGPSVSRLKDGRQGFVIREKPGMDAASRGEFERAVAMMNDGKNDAAIELLTRVIDRSPGVTAPYINIAMAYLRTGKLELAGQHFKTALALVPGHPAASNEYGLLLRKAGRFKEAREIYEKAIDGFPDYLPARRNLGILCDLYLNDPACALKQFEVYNERMPADGKVKIWIDELRMRLGR
jgi:Tfp pilus assembly protein PilF